MGVRITEQALDVIRRSLAQGGYDPAEVGVRLRVAGGAVRPRFAPGPEEGDETVEADGVRVFVDARIASSAPTVEIDLSSEHETLIVRPPL
jgi:Fe-S cluster assembly iron-binding protein IscA